MAYSYLKSFSGTTSSPSTAVSFTGASGPVASGNFLVAFAFWTDSSATATLTDSLGCTWTQVSTYQAVSGVARAAMWYTTAPASGAFSGTLTLSAAANATIVIDAYTSPTATTINASNKASSTGSSTVTAGLIAATSGDLIVSGAGTTTGSLNVAASTDFTNRFGTSLTGTMGSRMADDLSAGGNQTCTWLMSSSAPWIAFGASFTPASPPPPLPAAQSSFYATQIPQLPSLAPWTLPVFRAWPQVDEDGKDTGPPPPPPPPPPIPLPPPPPPGSPPTLPPDPPPRTGTYSPEITNDPTLERRIAFFTQQVSGLLNSLIRRNIIVYVGGENAWTINAPTFGGLTGTYGG